MSSSSLRSFDCRITGRKQKIILRLADDEFADDLLCQPAQTDFSRVAVVSGFVSFGRVDPDIVSHVEIEQPHVDDFAGSGGSKQLKLNDRPDLTGDERLDRLDQGVV